MHRFFLLFTLILLAVLLLNSCTQSVQEKSDGPLKDGTAQMVAELQKVDSTAIPIENYALNSRRANMAEAKAKATQDPRERMTWTLTYAKELLRAGKTKESIDVVRTILGNYGGLDQPITDGNRPWFDLLAISYLRFAEQLNCAANHNAESCILPIQGKGIHRIRKWSEYAVDMYGRILEVYPNDQTAKWLLNVAHQTLGTWPEEVPSQWLIPESAFNTENPDFPRYWDVAMDYGVAIDGLSGGSIMDDFNNDGWPDIFATSYGLLDQARLLINQEGQGFEDKTEAAGLSGITSGLNCMQMDFNNDGWLDVFILRGGWLREGGKHPNSLLMNTGGGNFIDVTKSAGIYSKHPTQTACWCDFNLDGWIDVFIGNESARDDIHPSELYINNGDGTFKEMAESKGLTIQSYVKGVTCGDINNDGRPDLYLSVLGEPNQIFLNRKQTNSDAWIFQDITANTNVSEPVLSFPTWMYDYNQDGFLDIFVSGYDVRHFGDIGQDIVAELENRPLNTALPKLYRNNGNLNFTEVSAETGVDKVMYTMGCNYGDLNNDGYPDFYAGTGEPDFESIIPNRMFLNLAGKKYTEVTTPGGFGNVQKGHGVSFADFDRDGDQDIYIVMGGAYEGDRYQNLLFKNPTTEKNWVQIKLTGTKSNTAAIGARVKIVAVQPDGSERTFHHQVSSGASFGGNTLTIEAGLDESTSITNLAIQWPNASGTVEEFSNIQLNRRIHITEGDKKFRISD